MNGQGLRLHLFLLCACLAGCSTSRTAIGPDQPVSKEMAKAEALYAQENYTGAMMECIDLARKDPTLPGLSDLQGRIMEKLGERRAKRVSDMDDASRNLMSLDVDLQKLLPGSYGLRRGVRGETSAMRGVPTAMQKVLDQKVTVHLDDAKLKDFILQIGASDNVNIIMDSIPDTKTVTVHAEDAPLSEILEYVSRNMGITFTVGENIIWATPRDSTEPLVPLETRVYRLRRGISSEEIEAGAEGVGIVEAIDRFIPKVPGADMLFNAKAHVLIAKNTRENMARIEDIIEALDVCPPQVLIEARFISAGVSDLSELGVDWILNSPWIVSRTRAPNPVGNVTHLTETQIAPGASIGFVPFADQAQGMNLTYQGLLTEPMFQAVLHALELSGKSRTLSVPKVTTVNNREAKIRIGEDFRYFEEFDVQEIPSQVTDQGNTVYSSILVPVGTPELEELGIELTVTPSVGADLSAITLKIHPEISEFVRYEHYNVGNQGGTTGNSNSTNAMSLVRLPIFRRSKIETELIVQSGETVVMGGLISSDETRSLSKVPILSSIPLIGRFFQHDTVDEAKQNLLIFVTASILSDRGESLYPVSATEMATGGK